MLVSCNPNGSLENPRLKLCFFKNGPNTRGKIMMWRRSDRTFVEKYQNRSLKQLKKLETYWTAKLKSSKWKKKAKMFLTVYLQNWITNHQIIKLSNHQIIKYFHLQNILFTWCTWLLKLMLYNSSTEKLLPNQSQVKSDYKIDFGAASIRIFS